MQHYLVYNTQAGSSSKLSPVSGPGKPLQIVSGTQKEKGYTKFFIEPAPHPASRVSQH